MTYEDVADANGLTSDIGLTYGYDFSTGNRTWERDGNGNITDFEYDRLGRLTRESLPDGSARTYVYDDSNNTATATDACGNGIIYFYSGLGNLEKVEDVSTETILGSLQYDSKGNLVKRYDGEGNYQTWTYDQLSRMESTSNFDEEDRLLSRTEVSFDEVFREKGLTYHKVEVAKKGDAEDRVLIYLFDPYERLELLGRVSDQGIQYSTYAYDYLGNNISSTGFDGESEKYQYDGLGRIIRKTDALGNSISNEFDLAGNLLVTTDALGQSKYYEYDSLGRSTSESIPYEENSYSTSKTFYDGDDNVIALVDPEGNLSKYEYDSRGFLESVELAAGTDVTSITRYKYDEEGRLKQTYTGLDSYLDTDYSVKEYEYDSLGRLVLEMDSENKKTNYEYDRNGNLLRKTDRNGITTELVYDGLNRVVSKKNSKDGEESLTEFVYDLMGNTSKMSDATGDINYAYDRLGRLTDIDYGNGIIQSYSYDENSSVTGFSINRNNINEMEINYDYDSLGSLTEIENEGRRYVYRYDSIGRLVEGSNEYSGIRTEYCYYPSGNIKNLIHYSGDDILESYGYSYNRNGNVTQETTGKGTTNYYYDSMSRLDTAIMNDGNIQNYDYDDFNNISRLVEIKSTESGSSMIFENTYSYDLNGRLTAKRNTRRENVEEFRFTYDNEGNQLIKEVAVSGPNGVCLSQVYSFGYNGYNQLDRVVDPNNMISSYEYNGNGLRTSKIVGDETTRFYYDNGSIVMETDIDNQIMAENTRGLSLVARDTGTEMINYLHDAHGDVVKLADVNGSIIMDYEYDPYGNSKESDPNSFGLYALNLQSQTEIDNPYRYSGEYLDDETGYYYLRARYYDPQVQKFISEDSYKGNINEPMTLNCYSYCWNDPLNYADPSGYARAAIEGGAVFNQGGTTLGEVVQNTSDSYPYNMDETGFYLSQQYYLAWLCGSEVNERLDDTTLSHNSYLVYEFEIMRRNGTDLSRLTVDEVDEMAFENASFWYKADTAALTAFGTYNAYNYAKGLSKTKSLYHYTNEKGMNGIVESKQLKPSLKATSPKDARYGNGQYMSDIMPNEKTPAQLSRQFINVPNKYKYTNYVEIDVTGLKVVKGREGVFVVPNEYPLDVTNRILNYGKVGIQ